jgi:hypothetical protein
MDENGNLTMKIIILPLPLAGEGRVRVGSECIPLTSILSPGGEEI